MTIVAAAGVQGCKANSGFDPRDLVQVKYEMLRRVSAEGHSVVQSAKAFGLSRPSFYQAQAALQREGLAGLLAKKRGRAARTSWAPK